MVPPRTERKWEGAGIHSSSWPAWLGEEPADEAHLKSLLAPYSSDGMMCWPVSPRVGGVKNNDPSLVEPIDLP